MRNTVPEDSHFAQVRAIRAAVKNKVYHAGHGMVDEIHGHFPVFTSGCFITVLVHELVPLECAYTSRTPRIRTLLPADAGGSFVNGLKKTNVCFAAACFSLCSLHYSIKRGMSTTPPFIFYMLLHFYQTSVILSMCKYTWKP